MQSAELHQSINHAIDASDWGQIRTLGEQALAEGEATSQILYNLGLAYLQENNPSSALAVLLAIPRKYRDQSSQKAIQEALARANLDQSTLDLGSHGLETALVEMAEVIAPVPFQFISSISLLLLIFAIIVVVRLSKTRQSFLNSRFGRMLGFGIGVLALIVMASLSLGWFSSYYRGDWCAIVASDAKIHLQPNVESEVIREIQTASPVLATSNTRRPWVSILHSSGASGWVESLKMRCVDEPK